MCVCVCVCVCVQVLASKTKELDKLKSDWSAHTTSLISEHSARITAEKEKAIQVRHLSPCSVCILSSVCLSVCLSVFHQLQAEAERRLSQERRDIEQAHTVKVRELERMVTSVITCTC